MRRRLVVVSFGGLICVVASIIWLTGSATEVALPSFVEVREAFRPSDRSLLDRHGEILHEQRVDFHVRRLTWTSLADISPALRAAVIASEDRRFDRHSGVDSQAILGAIARRLIGKPLRLSMR